MLWIFLFSAVALMGLYYVHKVRCENRAFLRAVVLDDSDMKIVPSSGTATLVEDDGEKAAKEFVAQKENGNIDKAYGLGNRIADVFFEENGIVFSSCGSGSQPFILLQRKILFAFTADAVLGEELPSVLAETVSQQFSTRIQKADPDLYGKVNDPKTFSYYLLCTKKGKLQLTDIGRAFARLCGDEKERSLCSLGECLYREYAGICRKMIVDTKFC